MGTIFKIVFKKKIKFNVRNSLSSHLNNLLNCADAYLFYFLTSASFVMVINGKIHHLRSQILYCRFTTVTEIRFVYCLDHF